MAQYYRNALKEDEDHDSHLDPGRSKKWRTWRLSQGLDSAYQPHRTWRGLAFALREAATRRRPGNKGVALLLTRGTLHRSARHCHRTRHHFGAGVPCCPWSMGLGSRTRAYAPTRLAWPGVSACTRNAAASKRCDLFLSPRRQIFSMACLQSAGACPDLRTD